MAKVVPKQDDQESLVAKELSKGSVVFRKLKTGVTVAAKAPTRKKRKSKK
jgi:hypothetical protein